MWAAVLFLLLAAQPPLNDANVATMIKSGLPKRSIVLAIQLAGQRGNVDFDTSPPALIALKDQGATADILDAMLSAQAQKAVPGLPYETGVYFQTPTGWVHLQSFTFSPGFLLPDLSHKPRNVTVPAPAPHLRTDVRRPVFHARALDPAAGWQFLKLLAKHQLRASWTQGFPPRAQIDPSAVIPAEVSTVGGSIFTVRPAWSLEPGEYLLCDTVSGSHDLFECRAFTVAP